MSSDYSHLNYSVCFYIYKKIQFVLKFLFTFLYIGYFIAIVYNKFLVKRSIQLKHLSNVVFGLLICYYNFGI